MSLPDHLLEPDDDGLCAGCGRYSEGRLCLECRADVVDLYADEAITERRMYAKGAVED